MRRSLLAIIAPLLLLVPLLALSLSLCDPADAANQTATFSPVTKWDRDYNIQVKPYSMGTATVPGIQSYAAGQVSEEWVILAGTVGGLHSFSNKNTRAWVFNPSSQQVWSRDLTDPSSGLSQHTINGLSSSNTQSYQRGNTLFITGGYVFEEDVDNFTTYNDLTAVDLPELIDWVKTSSSSLPANTILQRAGAIGSGTDYVGGLFQVTGGGMFEIDGKTQLVFGQLYDGPYLNDGSFQKYTSQIRTFDIEYDHAAGTLDYSSAAIHPSGGDPSRFRRRDLNTFPILTQDAGGGDQLSAVALSGVFTETNGIWTVPVEISPAGVPSMQDPATDPNVFKQALNGYESAKLGMYSSTHGEMTEILFGGITANEFVNDPSAGNLSYQSSFPFTNQISAVTIDATGAYEQTYLGNFPLLYGPTGSPYLFGSDADFFPSANLALLEGDIIDLDAIDGKTLLGYIYGGIAAGSPNGFSANSVASTQVFTVEYVPVPEPASFLLLGIAIISLAARRRRQI